MLASYSGDSVCPHSRTNINGVIYWRYNKVFDLAGDFTLDLVFTKIGSRILKKNEG